MTAASHFLPAPARAASAGHHRLRGARRLGAGLLALLLAACGGGAGVGADSAAGWGEASQVKGNTARMAESLAVINARAYAAAAGNPFLNDARARALQAQLAGQPATEALELRFALAEEQLKAGRTTDAIDGLEALVKASGISWDSIAPHQKPFFDLLAVAYMRLGEQQNCLVNDIANICILPLRGGARHSKQAGARGAIQRYTALLRQYPDDRGSQWLLNLAWLQVGGYPDSVPKSMRIPGLATTSVERSFPEYVNVAGTVGLAVMGLAGGVNVEDFNGDGLLDLFTTGWGPRDPVHVFLADGKGGYADRTAGAGLARITGGLNALHADYDNDGDADVLVLRGAWMRESGPFPLSLLRNRGDGTFEDVTFDAGLYSTGPTNTAQFADFNLDGRLDLFVGYESYSKLNGGPSHRSKLFMGHDGGGFTEVSKAVGIDIDDFVKGAVWGDVNSDGLPDLYLSVLYGRNRLYMNRGGTSAADWHFEERGAQAGVQLPIASFTAMFLDVDNDGDEDLFVPSYDVNTTMHEFVAREYLGLPLTTRIGDVDVHFEDARLFRNRGDGTFEDMTATAGLARRVLFAMGSNFGDLDNDGWLDIYMGTGNPDLRSVIPNRMFRNVGGARFDEVTLPGGFGHLQKGHGVAFADMDRDGDQDIFAMQGGAYEGDVSTSVLFRNPGWAGTHWITLDLEGHTANRSAIGARIEVVVEDSAGGVRSLHRTVRTGGSFGAGPMQVHVGLGHAARIREVRVQWPDVARTRTVYPRLAMDGFYHLVQGAQPVALLRERVPFRTVAGPQPTMTMPGM
ncbi:MAG: VCBS repeat-containing protein [Gemmatimonadaceae bacterium]|nr:VCBS repeat-containing protein [Gemmatimonadaceae bacterium]